MAKKDNKSISSMNMKTVNQQLDFIDKGMSDVYKSTYSADNKNKNDLETIAGNINDTIADINILGNTNDIVSNVSKLLTNRKMITGIEDKSFGDNIKHIIGEDSVSSNIINTFMEDKFIKDHDAQIDLLCKYMSKLEDVVQTKVDNILSADHFTKEFLNVENISDRSKIEIVTAELTKLKDIYNLNIKLDEWLHDIIKYGEKFIYIVPYKAAMTRLLNIKNRADSTTITNESVEGIDKNNNVIITDCGIEVVIENGGLLRDVIEANNILNETVSNKVQSVAESFIINEAEAKPRTYKPDKDNLKIPDSLKTALSSDGTTTSQDLVKEDNIKINGAIVRVLERERIKPLYIEDMCIGYYYIEASTEDSAKITSNITRMGYNGGILSGTNSVVGKDNNTLAAEDILRRLSNNICKNLDANFINSNADLKRELYLMLRYNYEKGMDVTKVKITYIPPEDVVHLYFKKDPKTNRGISDLESSIIPATLYCTLYLSDTLGILTRGQDKRVFYVKQTVDTNISANLMNVINQIKKSNFNARSLNNLYNVLNILGKYNDYFIPLSASGDAPVQIETMQGQNIQINQELYDLLESLSLAPTDVTKEILEARNSLDYAIQATMSNSKFLRKMLKRQTLITPGISRIITMIYNYHYGNNSVLRVTLPAPQILNINNINQMIDANEVYSNNIVQNELPPDADEGLKAKVKKKISRYNLATHIPYDIIDKLIGEATIEYESEKKNEE